MAERSIAVLAAVFARLSRLYPAEFRRLFADDMTRTFVDECHLARRQKGAAGLFLFALGNMTATLSAVLEERFAVLRDDFALPPHPFHSEENSMQILLQDLAYAWRMMTRRPAMTLLAVITLALGIGVNSAIFSVVNAVLLRGSSAKNPDQMVLVYSSNRDGTPYGRTSYLDYRDLREQSDVFTDLAALSTDMMTYNAGERPRLLLGESVSANYFRVLGIRMERGRDFLDEEGETPGAHPVVILAHAFWQRQLGGDPAILGSTIELNGHELTVVGITPALFKGSTPGLAAEYWVPIAMHDTLSGRGLVEQRQLRWLLLAGRLRPGLTIDDAKARFETVAARLQADHPSTNEDRSYTALPAGDVVIHPEIDGALFGMAGLVMTMVALVLLIACSNIANLLLARASDRRTEIAVRLALGCGRGRLIRQLLTESLLLAGAGGVLGSLLATALARSLVGLETPLPIPLSIDLVFDSRVFVFTLGLALLTGLACGLAPALRASRPELVPDLKDPLTAAGAGAGYRKLGLRNVLVVTQVAVSSLLLIAAGLFLRSLGQAHAIDLGFDLRQGVVATMELNFRGYSEEEGYVFYRRLLERVRALPGMRAAALTNDVPLGFTKYGQRVFVPGRDEADSPGTNAGTPNISPGYFETMGITLVRGRDFTAHDHATAPGIVIVNETAARLFWREEEPLGQRLGFAAEGPFHEVVGVARDGKYTTLGEDPQPYVYVPHEQSYSSFMSIVAATSLDEAEMLDLLRREIAVLDPDLALFGIRTMSEHLEIPLFLPRLGAAILTALGLLGLVLASVGLYGVVAYAVGRRTREVGIRIAMGAERRDVLKLVVGEGMVLVLVGMMIGLGLAFAAGQLLSSWLYGISAADPWTFLAVPALLFTVAFAANLIPAWRATRIHPTTALRYE